jgi:hypothetical protein
MFIQYLQRLPEEDLPKTTHLEPPFMEVIKEIPGIQQSWHLILRQLQRYDQTKRLGIDPNSQLEQQS